MSTGEGVPKTCRIDLDNAWIAFDDVKLPRSALLSRYAEEAADGTYRQTNAAIKPFEMIGQRLYTGRCRCSKPRSRTVVSYTRTRKRMRHEAHPQLCVQGGQAALVDSAAQSALRRGRGDGVASRGVRRSLRGAADPAAAQRRGAIGRARPSHRHSQGEGRRAILIDLCWRLKQEVGSYTMGDSGFGRWTFSSAASLQRATRAF